MKLLLLLTVIAGVILVPLYKMRVRWVVDLWRRVKLIAIIYCVVITVAAVTRLILNFDAIYG